MSKMNPEIKAKWVAALRSGEYKQGKRYLRSVGEEFCCLGVLCDLAAKAGVDAWRPSADCYVFTEDKTLMPDSVNIWAGFSEVHLFGERVDIDGQGLDLASHNDSGRTFAQIADAIEAQL